MDDRERQLEQEGAQRHRVALLAIAAGVLYLLGSFAQLLVNSKAPAVGLLQGLSPALHGLKAATVDPRTSELRFIANHGVVNIFIAAVLAGAFAAMRWPLRYLRDAAVARGAPKGNTTLGLVNYAPPLLGLAQLALWVSIVIGAHNYIDHAARTSAAYTAASAGTFRLSLELVSELLLPLCLAIAFITVSWRAKAVGLVTKVIGWLGLIGGFLIFFQFVPLPLLQFLFLVGVGMMLLQLGGLALPPAWETGEAMPWVSQMQTRAAAGGSRGARGRRAEKAPTPAPTVPASASSFGAAKKRKRRRN